MDFSGPMKHEKLTPRAHGSPGPRRQWTVHGIGAGLLAISFLAAGCGHKATDPVHDEVDYSAATDLFAFPLRSGGTLAPDPMEAVAMVDGRPISRAAVEREVQVRLMQLRQRIAPEQLQQLAPRVAQEALQGLIVEVLLRDAIEAEGIAIDEAAVEEQIGAMKQAVPEGSSWEEMLESSNLTAETLAEMTRSGMRRDALLAARVRDVTEPDADDVEAAYEGAQEKFVQPASAEVRHLLVRVKEGAEDKDWAAAKETADGFYEFIGKGVSLEELAAQYSDDEESKEKGGLIGTVVRGNLAPDMDKTVFEGEIGEVSAPTRTPIGYHLIVVESRVAERQLELDEVEEVLSKQLFQQAKQAAAQEYIEKLIAQAEIVLPGQAQPDSEQTSGTDTPAEP